VGKQPGKDGFLGNAPVTYDANLLNRQLILGEGRMGAYSQGEHEQQAANKRERARGVTRNMALNPRSAGDGSVLDLHWAGALRRAQVLVRSKNRLHGKNMHTLIA